MGTFVCDNLFCFPSHWKHSHKAIEESHSLAQKATGAFMVVQSHQVKVLQAQPGLAWVRCEQLGGGVVISTESQTVEALAAMQA